MGTPLFSASPIHYDPKRSTLWNVSQWGNRYLRKEYGFRPAHFAYHSFKLMRLTELFGEWVNVSEQVFSRAANGTTVIRFLSSIGSLHEAWSELTSKRSWAKGALFIRQIAQSSSLGLYTALSFTSRSILRIPASALLCVSDSIELYGDYREWKALCAPDLVGSSIIDMRKTHRMLLIAKATFALASALFFLSSGPQVIYVVCSLTVSALSMRADYYKAMRMPLHFPGLTEWVVSSPLSSPPSPEGGSSSSPALSRLPSPAGSPKTGERSLLNARVRPSIPRRLFKESPDRE